MKMRMAVRARYWFRPLRSIVVGVVAGSVIVRVTYGGAALPSIGMLALLVLAFIWYGYPTFAWLQTDTRVEAFMQERCRCTHARREHGPYPMAVPTCNECSCDWFFVPVVFGPWDPKWSIITHHHREDVVFGWLLAIAGVVLLAGSYYP